MNQISPDQIAKIHILNALGARDNRIAKEVGVSLSTVKRYRKAQALTQNCPSNALGAKGEAIVADAARARNFKVELRKRNSEAYDFKINGFLVDVKTARENVNGTYRFRLAATRRSYYGKYKYAKDYSSDCDMVALVCVPQDGSYPTVYLLDAAYLPQNITISANKRYEASREDWGVFSPRKPTNEEFDAWFKQCERDLGLEDFVFEWGDPVQA